VDIDEPPRSNARRWLAVAAAALVAIAASGFAFDVSEHASAKAATAATTGKRSDSLQDALYAVAVQQSLQRAYLLRPTPHELRWFGRAGASIDQALAAAKIDSTPIAEPALTSAQQLETHFRSLMNRSAAAPRESKLAARAAAASIALQRSLTGLSRAASQAADHARSAAQSLSEVVPVLVVIAAAGTAIALVLLILMLLRTAAVLRRTRQIARQRTLIDELTGLPNRALAQDRAEQALLAARRAGEKCALLLIDVDRFKDINDSLGHDHGDELLSQIGPRLRGVLRESDTVARLGGDEFCVVLPTVADLAAATQVAAKLHIAFEEPFEVNGTSLGIEASIGLVVAPDHGEDARSLLRRAEVAMYVAKEHRLGLSCYEPGLDGHSAERATLLGDLRKAMNDGQLVLHYQPKVDLASGKLRGLEALVRWNHPEHGLLSPERFLPLAERTGLIHPLTRQVLNSALCQVRSWRDAGTEIQVAVNLSARLLINRNFTTELSDMLRFWDVPGRLLRLEITESALMVDPDRAQQLVAQVGELGVTVSIDDFGTGYSSLTCLRSLPVHELKIDHQFVRSMLDGGNDAFIVRSVIDLGHNLGLQVVAEGVENEATRQALAELGCDIAQGYWLGKAVPAAALDLVPAGPANASAVLLPLS
jgi:diguanylate cyclase (GGDEF)-like protein